MATPVVFNGVNYSVPAFGDVGYAQGPGNLSAYLIAIASGTLQITGGLFSLTSDANFGPNFGLVSVYYKTASANIATAGEFRLAVGDTIEWRNNANTLNLPLGVNGLDQLTFNGVVISTAAAGGTVNPGLQFQIPYYAANGNTVSAAANIHYNASGDFEVLGGHNVVFDGATSGAVSMKAPAIVTIPYTLTLPPNPGTANYSLQTDGSGTTSWAPVQTTAFREDYIVGTASGTYTGSLTVFNLANAYTVGAHTLIVTLDGDVQTLGASADYLETNSTTVTFNFPLVVGERVSFLFSSAVTSSGGTVNSGTAPRLAQYAASGTTISGIGSDASANGFKITGLAAGTANGDAVRFENVITSLLTGYAQADGVITSADSILTAIQKAGAHRIMQAPVIATSTTSFATTSASFQTANLSASITPKATTSKILVFANGTTITNSPGNLIYATISRGGSNLANASGLTELATTGTGQLFGCGMMFILDSPASVASLTYAVQIKSANGAGTVSFGDGTQVMVLIEIGV